MRLAVVGVTGVGKTTTCNALLGTTWEVGHYQATTRSIQEKRLVVETGTRRDETNIIVLDFPGLGETRSRDSQYLPLYDEALAEADAILWLLTASDRQLSLIQQFFDRFRSSVNGFESKIVIGLNKSDLAEPMQWGSEAANLPSQEQAATIEFRRTDVVEKMNSEGFTFIEKDRVVPFSAKFGWRVWDLFGAVSELLSGPKGFTLLRYAQPREWAPDPPEPPLAM